MSKVQQSPQTSDDQPILTKWQKLKLWFNICPSCNGKLHYWSIRKLICTRCGKDWV